MSDTNTQAPDKLIDNLSDLSEHVDYSLLDNLSADPEAIETGEDYHPRQIYSGHYVPVKPTPIQNPQYIAHSKRLFEELGFADSFAQDSGFKQLFSGDLSEVPLPMRSHGWATGYALSIYGTEYIQQCPFQTGNGYGDGRALSIVEAVLNGKRWEMQLKGAGRTPYCRGADGRAVLRSSVREFLAQEHMHALGVPTSRSLSLFMSTSETVERPWYIEGSDSVDPEIIINNLVAISTRVAPSFLRIGQLELFSRRVRNQDHLNAGKELRGIVVHLIDREYADEVDKQLPFEKQVIQLAIAFRQRLTSLIAKWVQVGYCQGNFNSDNCASGGFTLDYGPFGFCEMFDPVFQPWTGGGRHFSFLNQPVAAEKNYAMFCRAIQPLLTEYPAQLSQLDVIQNEFASVMENKMEHMWASKLGIERYDGKLVIELFQLMVRTSVDYTLFFRELSCLPSDFESLTKSFYKSPKEDTVSQWQNWFARWKDQVSLAGDSKSVSDQMKRVNPKYTWREWLIVPAYKQAETGNFALINELQEVLNAPFEEQSPEVEEKYYRKRPSEYFQAGGISHYSCSS